MERTYACETSINYEITRRYTSEHVLHPPVKSLGNIWNTNDVECKIPNDVATLYARHKASQLFTPAAV